MVGRRGQRQCVPVAMVCLVLAGGVLPCMSAYSQDTIRITLPEAIELAASRNVDLLRAENSFRTAQTRIETARGAFQPTLSLSAGPSVRYQLGSQTVSTGETSVSRGDNATGSFSLGVSSGYTLYNGNADRASLAQAEQLARATDIGVDRTAQTITLSVISSFYQIATSRELIGVERQNLEAEQQQLERIKAFTDAGTRPISDLYTEQATVAAAEVRLLQAERDYAVATLDLVQTLSLDPLKAYDFPAPAPAVTGNELSTDATALVQQAYTARPEIAAQQAQIEAAQQGIKIADATDAPSLSVSGSLGSSYSTSNDLNGFTSQLFSQNPNASLGLSFSLPIFDRNRTDAAVAQADIAYQNEMLTMAALRQQIAVEVQQAYLDLNTATAQLGAAERQLAASTQALDVEQTRYDSGISTLTELVQARARYIASQGQVVQGRNTVEMRRQQLVNAIGGIQAVRGTPQAPKQ